MADRKVKVSIVAEASGYIAGMDQAARKTRETASEAEKLAAKRQGFQQLGTVALAMGVAAAAGIGLMVGKAAEFDQAMSNANAVMQESAENQRLLRDAALEAGAASVFTATESANAVEELGKAGISTANILGGALTSSLDLAASGELGVARAAEIAGITMKQFNLEGSEAGRVADVLSAGANKAVGSVEDLANGLKFVGPVASNMNVSLEDTVATLALFADQGIIGEAAGTSLRGMLSSLTSPSKTAAKELDRLGISLYDANGQFLGLEHATDQLSIALGGATDAERDLSLGILFGNAQVTAARVLVGQGAEGWRDYRDAMDATGLAQQIASDRLDNLMGDVEALGGAMDTALIKTGSGANDVLRELVQSATFLVDGIGSLPEPVLHVGLALGVVAAAVGIVGGGALLAVPKIAEFKAALKSLEISGKSASLGIGAVSIAATALLVGVGMWVSWQADIKATADELTRSLDQSSGAMTDYTRQVVAKKLADSGALTAVQEFGIGQEELTTAILEGGKAYDEVTRKLSEANTLGSFFTGEGIRAGNAAHEIRSVRDAVEQSGESFKAQKAAMGEASRAAEENTRQLKLIEGGADGASDAIDGLSDSIRGFGELTLDARDAERQFEAAIDDAAEALRENGTSLDINTAAGRQNEASLDAIAKAAREAAAAKYEQTGSEDLARDAIQRGRDALIAQLEQYGITGDAAEEYADQLGMIPANISSVVTLDTSKADQKLQQYLSKLTGASSTYALTYINGYSNAAGGMYSGGVKEFAAGGFSSGIYPFTPGGIHKFAEAGDEAYISFLPQYRERNVGIWAESGRRLGVWQNAPTVSGSGGSGVGGSQVTNNFDVRADDPMVVAQLVVQQLGSRMAVAG